MVVLSEYRRRRPKRAGRAVHAMLESFVRRRTHFLVLEPMPKAERLEIVVMMDIDAVLDRIGCHSGGLQLHGEIVGIVSARKRSNELVYCRGVLDPRNRTRKARVGGICRERG